jgi:hypothetical protein
MEYSKSIIDLQYIIGLFPIDFLNFLSVADILSLSTTSMNFNKFIDMLYAGMKPTASSVKVHHTDPFGCDIRKFPGTRIQGFRCLPNSNISTLRYCKTKGITPSLCKIPNHVIFVIDSSGSTGSYSCNIPDGPFSGNKTVLDISKLFIKGVIDCIKEQNKLLNVKKISFIEFDVETKLLGSFNIETQEVDLTILDTIESNYGTHYNKMINFVKNYVKNETGINHKMICLTDCQCDINSNTLKELVKHNCSIHTCMIPPGNHYTLQKIKNNTFDSGVHKILNVDFTQSSTVQSWSDCLAEMLIMENVSMVQIENSDDTLSVYNSSNVDNVMIPLSCRPIYADDENPEIYNLQCSDFMGKYKCCVKKESVDDSLPEKEFIIALKKITNMFINKSVQLDRFELDVRDLENSKKHSIVNLKRLKLTMQYLKFRLFLFEKYESDPKNKNLLARAGAKIVKWYQKRTFDIYYGHVKSKFDNDKVIKFFLNHIAKKIQQFYKKKSKQPNRNFGFGFDILSSYPMMHQPQYRKSNSQYDFDSYYGQSTKKEHYIQSIEHTEKEIKHYKKEHTSLSHDLKMNKEALVKKDEFINQIESTIEYIKHSLASAPYQDELLNDYDSIEIIDKSIKITKGIIKKYVPLKNIYPEYKIILDNMKFVLKNMNNEINDLYDTFDYYDDAPLFGNNAMQPQLFRDVTSCVPPMPTMLRQVSNSIALSPGVSSLGLLSVY